MLAFSITAVTENACAILKFVFSATRDTINQEINKYKIPT